MSGPGSSHPSRFATVGRITAAAVLGLLSPGVTLAQCSLCRDALASSSGQTRDAMNLAIIGLALAPYAVAASAAWALSPRVRSVVRNTLSRLVFPGSRSE